MLLLVVASLASGCIYLRLLQFQRQLKEFDAHFRVHTTGGLVLEFLDPMLLEDDLRWFGFVPHTRTPPADVEIDDADPAAPAHLDFRWVKQLPPEAEAEPHVYDLDAAATVRDERIATIELPERLFAVLPKTLFVDMIRAFGRAQVDRKDRSATAAVERAAQSLQPPTRDEVMTLVGRPWSVEQRGHLTIHEYRYAQQMPAPPPTLPGQRAPERIETPPPVVVRLSFDTETGVLHAADIRLARGKFHVALPPPKSATASPSAPPAAP